MYQWIDEAAGLVANTATGDALDLSNQLDARVQVFHAWRAAGNTPLAAPVDRGDAQRELALAHLRGVNFAARRAAINATTLPVGAKAILRAMNRTEWALAVLVLGLSEDDPGES